MRDSLWKAQVQRYGGMKIHSCTLVSSMGFSLTHQVNKVQRWLALSRGVNNSPMKLSIKDFHSQDALARL